MESRFKFGDRVKVTHGPNAGASGTVTRGDYLGGGGNHWVEIRTPEGNLICVPATSATEDFPPPHSHDFGDWVAVRGGEPEFAGIVGRVFAKQLVAGTWFYAVLVGEDLYGSFPSPMVTPAISPTPQSAAASPERTGSPAWMANEMQAISDLCNRAAKRIRGLMPWVMLERPLLVDDSQSWLAWHRMLVEAANGAEDLAGEVQPRTGKAA